MHRDQRKQRDQPRLTVGQAHQWNADHDGVAEGCSQRQHRRAPVQALPNHDGRKQQPCRHEIHGHRLEVELLHMHRAHGAKKQRWREHHEDQI